MILVIGATGLVGTAVCQKLTAQGESVRALVRESSSTQNVDRLRSAGIELCAGDLKDFASIASACHGADAVISTASSTLSRQPGDSIESVDLEGQLNLVNAAKDAGVDRFVFTSFRHNNGLSFPLADAKQQVETAVKSFNFTIIQASWFMEVWLSPALGFDYRNAKARIYGSGVNPISWVSFHDVAEICALSLRHHAAERKTIEFGGPEPLTPLEVVSCFERVGGRPFELDFVSEPALISQLGGATDSMQKSFAGLMLSCAKGDAIEMSPVIETFGVRLTSVDEYASRVLAAE